MQETSFVSISFYTLIYISYVEDCVIDIRKLQEKDRMRRKEREGK
jgi:hypothetical protein